MVLVAPIMMTRLNMLRLGLDTGDAKGSVTLAGGSAISQYDVGEMHGLVEIV